MILQLILFIGLPYMMKLLSISLNAKVIEQACLEMLHVSRDIWLYALVHIL